MDILERFKKYIAFDTISDDYSDTFPSTPTQLEFGKMLVEDLHELGLTNAYQDEFGYVYGRIDAGKERTIGLISHMDTAPAFVGGCSDPLYIEKYDGKEITLKSGDKLNTEIFNCLNEVVGDELLLTDGYHLLGGDDKAGVSIIFEVVKYFISHKDELKWNLAICFTPDEEVGRGPEHFSVKKMNADIAYTMDGGSIYDASYENFNAASAIVNIKGINVHPGSAKNIMVNSVLVAMDFNSQFDPHMIPSETEDYEGFIHLDEFKGDVNETTLVYILRDHDEAKLELQKEAFRKAEKYIKEKYPKATIDVQIKDSYKNMQPVIIKNPEVIELINKAYLASKTKISYSPIRGGTDGATITYMGIPCPNLGVGDFNMHGKFEFVSITQMKKMVEIVKNLLRL